MLSPPRLHSEVSGVIKRLCEKKLNFIRGKHIWGRKLEIFKMFLGPKLD